MIVAVGSERTFVIDTGFTEEVAGRRGRTFLRCPVETLALLDVESAKIQDVILTHLHYDHVGNFHRFPAATFHLQEAELAYATGRICVIRGSRIHSKSRTWLASCASITRGG